MISLFLTGVLKKLQVFHTVQSQVLFHSSITFLSLVLTMGFIFSNDGSYPISLFCHCYYQGDGTFPSILDIRSLLLHSGCHHLEHLIFRGQWRENLNFKFSLYWYSIIDSSKEGCQGYVDCLEQMYAQKNRDNHTYQLMKIFILLDRGRSLL